jgi:hypothetical protein
VGIREGYSSTSGREDRPSILGALRDDSTILPDVERRPVHPRSASRRFLGTHQRSLDSSGEPWISVQVPGDVIALHGRYAIRHSDRYVLPAATREISQLLVNCLVRSAELLSLLFCDLSGGLLSLPASQ